MVGSVLVHLWLALSISFPFRINHEREISFHLHHEAEVLLWYYLESSTMNVGCREKWWFHNELIYRRDVNSEDESEEEPDPGLFQGCSENKLGQENRTSRCHILIDSNGPFVNCHSMVSPDFFFTWVSTADSHSPHLQNHFGTSFWQEFCIFCLQGINRNWGFNVYVSWFST